MAINKKLIHFQNKSTFNAQLKAGNLKDTSIVFIKDTQEIWTHGQLYSKNELQEALQNLSNNLDTISNNVTTNTRNLELQDKRIDYNTTAITDHIQNKQNPHSVTKEQVGLSKVTNDAQVKRSEMGTNNGVATLDANGKVPESQLPAGVTSALILGEEEGTAYEGSKGSRNKFLLDRLINHGLSTIDSESITNTNTGIKIPNDNLIYNASSTDIDVVDSPINIPVADKTKTTGSGLLLNTDKKKLDGLFDIAGGLQDIDVANPTANDITLGLDYYTFNKTTGETGTNTRNIHIPAATTSHAGLMSAQDKAKLNSLSVTENGIPAGGSKNQILAWQSDGVAKWEDLSNVFGNLEDVLAYGVQWDDNQIDSHLTRIGNMSLHKSLPIQNQLRGCIAQGNVVQYWLDNNDWRFKSSVSNPANVTLGLESTLSLFKIPSINQVDINTGRYFYCIENTTKCIGKITNVSGEDVTVEWDNAPTTVPKKIVMGSMLDGFDGTVKIYCPEFYILSQHKNSKHRVLISTVKLSDQWEHQPAILVDAYKCTVLNTKTDYGYLATLPINSAISVVNTNAYCRGGENRANLDQYLTGEHKSIWNTDLGKPRTNINRTTMRTYAKNAGCDLINYNQYKNIFYWLYVIEYANFNCQEEMQSLTAEGYRQGGLGQGLSNFLEECVEQGHTSMCAPCGVGDTLGNRTNQILAADTVGTYYIPRWRGFENTFGELCTVIDGLNISNAGEGLELYACTDPKEYNDNLIEAPYTSIGKVESQNTYVTKFNLGIHAHIIPKEFISTTSAEIGPLYCHFNTKHVGEPAAGGRMGLNTKCGLASIDFLTSDKYAFAGYRTVSTDVQLPN